MDVLSFQWGMVGERSVFVNSSFVVWMNSKEEGTLHVGLLEWDDSRREKWGYGVVGGIESLCDNSDVLNSIIDCLSVEVGEIPVS